MEQLAVDRAKKVRRTVRGLVTKLVHKGLNYLKEEPDAIDRRKLWQFLADLKDKSTELKEVDKVVLDDYFDTDADEDTCDKEAEEANAIQERILYSIISIEDTLTERSEVENLSVCAKSV